MDDYFLTISFNVLVFRKLMNTSGADEIMKKPEQVQPQSEQVELKVLVETWVFNFSHTNINQFWKRRESRRLCAPHYPISINKIIGPMTQPTAYQLRHQSIVNELNSDSHT